MTTFFSEVRKYVTNGVPPDHWLYDIHSAQPQGRVIQGVRRPVW